MPELPEMDWCPSCGGRPRLMHRQSDPTAISVACFGCGLYGPMAEKRLSDTPETLNAEAIALWNALPRETEGDS